MSLQLILGSSGAGKSHYLYTHIIEESMKNPDRNYIVVVPEQYTMAIQKRLVSMHPRKGILNIDVVSFERLAYKVFEEVGEDNLEVLDDTGKNLIIKRVLEQNKDRLKYFGSNLSNTGFVSEMKSVISEMLQYDIKPDVMQDAAGAAYSDSKGSVALQYKLDDIVLVYNAFAEYIDKNYITKEEILDKLCSKVTESERIKNCEIVFDGFTGFTPVQYNLMTILLSAIRAKLGSWVAIRTIFSSLTNKFNALFLSIPAFSISSINTMGEVLNIAVSAIIKALDCPPLNPVTGVSKLNFSPANSLAASTIFETTSCSFSIILLFA